MSWASRLRNGLRRRKRFGVPGGVVFLQELRVGQARTGRLPEGLLRVGVGSVFHEGGHPPRVGPSTCRGPLDGPTLTRPFTTPVETPEPGVLSPTGSPEPPARTRDTEVRHWVSDGGSTVTGSRPSFRVSVSSK